MCNLQHCLGDFARPLKVHFTSNEGIFKDPGCCSRRGLNLRPPAQQTVAVLKLWTDNHYVHQNILKGLLKRNFSTASVGG